MRKFIHTLIPALSVAALPLITMAQPVQTYTGLMGTIQLFSRILNGLIGVAVTLAIVVFFWGLVQYLFKAGPEGKSEGLKTMFFGVVTIFVMVSVWGLVRLLQLTFNVQGSPAQVPQGIQLTNF